ncbi:class I SAM-dependent methyltransferase [Rhabdothermincola sp.]|uniref:class I SAM-dependent methyltransferase n=1 Tax=Rhabdothermincola sp. TaxID=2820405 RepID=UPI002FE3B890
MPAESGPASPSRGPRSPLAFGGGFDGARYQARFDQLQAQGVDIHGEANFVASYRPRSVLDAGCGTGRVAIELHRRGVEVVGADRDPSMLAVARERAPEIEWVLADLASLELSRAFDVVVLAGNVPLFTAPGTEASLVAGCARHVRDGGWMVAGFQLGRGYTLADYDEHCGAAGLVLVERYGTWDREPFADGGDYAVSIHQRLPAP